MSGATTTTATPTKATPEITAGFIADGFAAMDVLADQETYLHLDDGRWCGCARGVLAALACGGPERCCEILFDGAGRVADFFGVAAEFVAGIEAGFCCWASEVDRASEWGRGYVIGKAAWDLVRSRGLVASSRSSSRVHGGRWMDKVFLLMLATAAPAPYRAAPHPPRRPTAVRYERSPIWDHNPVRVARFGNDLAGQLAAQRFGAERHRAYAEQMARFRVPIVGQVQVQTSVSRSFSTTVR